MLLSTTSHTIPSILILETHKIGIQNLSRITVYKMEVLHQLWIFHRVSEHKCGPLFLRNFNTASIGGAKIARQTSASAHLRYKDEFKEFIEKSHQKEIKYQPQIELKFEVWKIDQIVFEYTDGTGVNFSDLFEYRASIGSGGFGFVVAALDLETGEEIAIKLLRKDDIPDIVTELFKKEAEILQKVHDQTYNKHIKSTDSRGSSRLSDTPTNIIGFKFFKEFSNYLILGMELWTGGTLSEWVKEKVNNKERTSEQHEEECALITKNILKGLSYIHENHEIIHRDLKPSNILFLRKDDLNSLKIWDFGLANNIGVGYFHQNDDNAGTLIYQAPEQVKSTSYGKKIDIWATGMIMYEILTKGGHPILGIDFYKEWEMSLDEYKNKMMKITSNEQVVKPKSCISSLAFKLLQNLLNVNPKLRYSANKALKHPWITRDKDAKIPLNMFEEMELHMRAYEKLKLATRVAFAMSLLNEKVIKTDKNLIRYVYMNFCA